MSGVPQVAGDKKARHFAKLQVVALVRVILPLAHGFFRATSVILKDHPAPN